ncbi:MAG: 6-phosphogluconolactonase [Ahrensia sp.]|nr:6-phosphogluconolactonase [Ahrensia sp.]
MAVEAFHNFEDRESLAAALTSTVAGKLRQSLEQTGVASLAVSGGSTPGLFFERLSTLALDWRNVTVALVDERDVPLDHERSNERLVRQTLLTNAAAEAQFLPIRDAQALAGLPDQFTVLILGMGTDGHTASWFPNGDTLEAVTDPDCLERVMALEAPCAGEKRYTLTMPAVAQARFLALHIEGDKKRETFDAAMDVREPESMPVALLLRDEAVKLHVFWAP